MFGIEVLCHPIIVVGKWIYSVYEADEAVTHNDDTVQDQGVHFIYILCFRLNLCTNYVYMWIQGVSVHTYTRIYFIINSNCEGALRTQWHKENIGYRWYATSHRIRTARRRPHLWWKCMYITLGISKCYKYYAAVNLSYIFCECGGTTTYPNTRLSTWRWNGLCIP